MFYLQNVTGCPFDGVGDRVPMRWSEYECLQNQHIESALE